MTERGTQTDGSHDRLMSPHHAAFELLGILLVHSEVHRTHPDRMSRCQDPMITALEVTLNCYRRGGCTPGQMKTLATAKERMEKLK